MNQIITPRPEPIPIRPQPDPKTGVPAILIAYGITLLFTVGIALVMI